MRRTFSRSFSAGRFGGFRFYGVGGLRLGGVKLYKGSGGKVFFCFQGFLDVRVSGPYGFIE